MSAELFEIYCNEIEDKTLIGVDLGQAFCKNQSPCQESRKKCVFCFPGQPLPLEKGATKRHIKEAIKMVRQNNGVVGLVSYKPDAPANAATVNEIDVPEEIEVLVNKFLKAKNSKK